MCFSFITWGQDNRLDVSLLDISQVTNQGEGGLYFAGSKNVNFNFSQRISPHGDCVDVVNGYAFVTWYKGGIENRNLMLSRKNLNVPNSNWVTIQFPHKHVGIRGELFKGTGTRGDSHNTAAIGVSTIDNTIHIIYDLHSYSASLLPTEFFNYSFSLKGKAFVPDNEFTLNIFNPKQTFLKQGQNYERLTYPMIHRADDGSLVARYRQGGSGNGNILMAHYNGTAWSNNWTYQVGTLPAPSTSSLYGGERFINGKFYSGFSIRYSANNSTTTSNGFINNSGFYYAYTNVIPKDQTAQWFDYKDNPITLPIRNNLDQSLDPVQFAQPSIDYGTATLPKTSSDPAWTVTKNGAIHFITRVDGRNVHYYKLPSDVNFKSNVGGLIPNPDVRGEIYSYKNHVFMAEIISGKLNIKTTLEGTNDWKIIYSGQENVNYNHFNAFIVDNKFYVYLMQNTGNNTPGIGDKRPLFFQEFLLSEVDSSTPITGVVDNGGGSNPVGNSDESDTESDVNALSAIQFEDFIEGNNQNETVRPGALAPFGYFDVTANNIFTNTSNLERFDYRPGTDVDIIRITSSTVPNTVGQVLVNSGSGEFLYYNVEILETGKYHIDINYGHGNANPRAIKFERVDENLENPQILANGSVIKTSNSFTMGTNTVTDATTGTIVSFDLEAGKYIIKATTVNSGPNYNWFQFVKEPEETVLSTNSFEKKGIEITLYPNPTTGTVYIDSKTQNINYKLYNLTGQLMQKGVITDGKVELSSQPKGFYLLHLIDTETENQTFKKIIIE